MILNKLVLIIVILALITGQASATEYSAKIKVEKYQSGAWVSDTNTLNKTDAPWNLFDISIKYTDINDDFNKIYFTITGTDVRDTSPLVEQDKTVCLRYEYASCFPIGNATPNDKAIKLTLLSINPYSQSTPVNASGDNPLYVYLFADKEVSIPKSTNGGADIRTFDAKLSSTNTGWTGSVSPSEVYVYFQKRNDKPISISMKTDVPSKPKEEQSKGGGTWGYGYGKFTLTANGNYVFTVKYDNYNIWGAKSEETEVYGFNLIGMAGNKGTSAAPRGVFDVNLPDAKILELGENVKFTETPTGVTTSPMGGKEYRFSFATTGRFRVKYTVNGVEDYAEFNVRQQVAPPTPTATPLTQVLTGNQNQPEDGGTDWFLVGIIAMALVGVIITGFWWKGRSSGPKIRVH